VGRKRRTHPTAGSCQGDRQRRCAAAARPWHSTEMSELVSSRPRDATRRAACHLTPGLRGAGTNRTNRDFAGALVGQGSDRLVDALVAWGDVEAVSGRVKDHLKAGADHVCIQVFDAEPHGLPLRQWRTLAMAML
jgi:hypothetical protein